MIEADGVIFSVLRQKHFGLILIHRLGALRGQVMCYDSDRGELPINYRENVFYEKLQAVQDFAYLFRDRIKTRGRHRNWSAAYQIQICTHMIQQEDGDANCGLYAVMKAISLIFGTYALTHNNIEPARPMTKYAITEYLYWKEE